MISGIYDKIGDDGPVSPTAETVKDIVQQLNKAIRNLPEDIRVEVNIIETETIGSRNKIVSIRVDMLRLI